MDAEQRAQAIVDGAEADFETVELLAKQLRAADRVASIGPMLIVVSRRALYVEWERERRSDLALLLREHQQFGYARRLLGRVRRERDDKGRGSDEHSETLRQQHALCTYKDIELPAARRLARALEILKDGHKLEECENTETLGIVGAIYKRKWDVEAKRADLERSLWFYQRGFAQSGDRWYAGINAAFVCDQLAAFERRGFGALAAGDDLELRSDEIRREIIDGLSEASDDWGEATLGEACFGLRRFEQACVHFAAYAKTKPNLWQLQTTAMQLAALARLRDIEPERTRAALHALLGEQDGALDRAFIGKVGLALSGGGFRASLFHIGVLARLAECDMLRHVEILSCVSGGAILGAFYYLRLRELLQSTTDADITSDDYRNLVQSVAEEFLASVQQNLRMRLTAKASDNWRMLASDYSRTDRAGALFEEMIYSKVTDQRGRSGPGPWRMSELFVAPRGRESGFAIGYENWRRAAKVPMLVLNATSLNTGRSWQFTASWMGEPPSTLDERIDANRRLRRVYYRDAPGTHSEQLLSEAVAASACVPGLFPPVTLSGLYPGIKVALVDGGVHDNQGISSLLEQDCTALLVSDASGQIRDADKPPRRVLGVAKRSNSVLMSRVRGAQYSDLLSRRRSGTLRCLMFVHLKKGLSSPPRDWADSKEPYCEQDDALAPEARPDYRLGEGVQRALTEIRTDLDAFSDDEAYALMAAGYLMTRHELAEALDGTYAGAAISAPVTVTWPFTPMVERLGVSEPDGELLAKLSASRARFFRGLIAWRERQQHQSWLTMHGMPRRVEKLTGRVLVTPLRAVLSGPPAAIGALATRLALHPARKRAQRVESDDGK